MKRIHWLQGDITQMKVDAIVNAANSRLAGGGGVDGAIHRAGGEVIRRACREARERLGGTLPTGQAVATPAGKLPARHVIHTVGPVWNGDQPGAMKRLLGDCYRNSLKLAAELGAATVAFPNISTGVYGFPKAAAAEVALEAVTESLEALPEVKGVYFVCFDEANAGYYRRHLGEPAPPPAGE